MKRFILPLFILFFVSTSAQQWLEPSASWTYQLSNTIGGGFVSTFIEKDSLINGQLCQKIAFRTAIPNTFPSLPNNYFTYQSNDSIFILSDNTFSLIIRRNMNIGDTLFLKRPSVDTAICQATSLYYRYRLDSIALYPKSDAPLNAYYFSRADTFKQWSAHNIYFVEKIGFNCLPYPFTPVCVFDGDHFDLCNYGDSTISGFWMNPNIKACETVGIEETKTNQAVYSISPNPSSSAFIITVDKFNGTQIEVGLYNVEGQKVKTIHINKQQTNVDGSDLPEGIYFLKSENSSPSKVMVLH